MKKQNKRSKLTRITLALLLILSMIGNTLILPAVAQESLAPTDETILPETPLDGTSDATGAATLPEPIQLTAADIPEFISAAALTERGAVERMRSEETNMSSVIFRNADGTRTMYMYGLPVKYTALDGTVRDKSTNLVSVSTAAALLADRPVAQTMAQMSTAQQAALRAELGILDAERAADTLHMLSTALASHGKSLSDMAYTTLDNDVYALFPTNLAQGMTLVFGEHSVRMTPAGNGLTVTAGGNVTKTTTASLADSDVAERLLYPNVFGLGTAVQYTPTLTGVKEEILLSHNVGKNSFDFLVETDGLILTETNGQFTLVDPETEQQVGKLGEIIVFDSAGQIVRGTMTAQTIKDGQIYGITIAVDQEFLAGATYPVSIDPTTIIESIVDDYEYGETVLIEDVSIYDHENASGYTFIQWHQIGTLVGGGTYQGQAAFRIPALYDSSIWCNYAWLTSNEINSVKLHIKPVMNTTNNSTIHISQYGIDWENTAKMFGSPYYDNHQISIYDSVVNNVCVDTEVLIDITNFAKEWLDYSHGASDNSLFQPQRGILLRYYDNNSGAVWLDSIENSADICVSLDYFDPSYVGDFYFQNLSTRNFLAADTTAETLTVCGGMISDIGTAITWNVEYEGNDLYSLHPNGQPNVYLNMNGEYTTVKSSETMWSRFGDATNGFAWTGSNGSVLGVDTLGEVVVAPNSSFTTAEQKKWRMVATSNYVELDNMPTISDRIWIAPEQQYDVFYHMNLEGLHLVDKEDFEFYVFHQSVVSQEGSTITGILPNDATMIRIRHIPTGQIWVNLIDTTSIPEGTYFLKNKQTLDYAKVNNEALMAGQYVVQYDLDGNLAERWIIKLDVTTGYYSIRSAMPDSLHYYMAVSNDSSALNRNVVISSATETTLTDGMKWRIEIASNGAYSIIPKTGEANGYVLIVNTLSGTNNTTLLQGAGSDDWDYRGQWSCIRMLPTNGYEIVYDASTWAGIPSINNNCYAYALNNQVLEPTGNSIWFKQQPGEYYNIHRGNNPAIPEGYKSPPSVIVNSVQKDFSMYNSVNGMNVTFTPIGRYEICPIGTYKVALVVSNSDYHWYRQDSDGLWSHKRGTTPVKRTDESGDLIIDPMIADRDGYTTFVGFYAVKPWNNMYSTSRSSEIVHENALATIINDELLSRVELGMTYDAVIEMLKYEGVDVGSGTIIQQYYSNNGRVYTFEYLRAGGSFVVSNIFIEEE